jgi:EmrB/QacA subfamily drug resistance transporter
VPASQPAPQKWSVFAAVGLGYFITVVTTTLSVLALRAIAEDFDVTLRTVGWVVIIESLIIAALLLPLGGLSDVVGRHRMLRAGVAVFGVGLILTGFAPSFALLIVARIVTAVGNTMVQSVSTGILVAAFPPEERGLALGGQTTAVAVGAAVGPLLGGLLLDELDWQLLFLLLAIPTVVTFVVVHRVLGAEPLAAAEGAKEFDAVGAAFAAGFITVLVLTLSDPFEFGFASPVTIAGAALAGILLTAFVRVEVAHDRPMLDVRVFQIADFRRAVGIRAISFIASSSIMFLIPVFLLGVRDLSTRATGVIFALFAVGMTLGAQVSGRLYDRVGARPPMVVGLLIQVGVLALLATVDQNTAVPLVAMASIGNGLGQGLWNVPANSVMMGAMPAGALGVGGAFSNVTRTVGSVVGQAGATAIVASVMASQGFDIPLGDVVDTQGAGAAFVDGWQVAYLVALAVTAISIFIAFRTDARPRNRSTTAQ